MHPRRRSLHSWSFVLHSIARNGRPKGRLVKDSLKVSRVVFSALVQLFKSRIFARSTRTLMSMLKPRSIAALAETTGLALCALSGVRCLAATVSPTSISWVSVAVGKGGAPKAATLTNNGTATITISGITLTGANPGDYQISSKTCGTSLAASASCTATIVFAPTTTGTRTATLNFTDTGTGSPQTVALSGTGTAGSAGTASATPSTISWVSVAVGKGGAPKAATLTNGATAITISGVTLSGANPGDYKISSKTCGTGLAASATLNFTDTATNSPQTVALSGLGIAATGITISPLSPTVAVNGTVQFTANATATWTATCGTIGSTTALYTAPATTGACR